MSGVPSQPTTSNLPEGAGVGPDLRRDGAFRFWRNFAQANDAECRDALAFLSDLRGVDYGGLAAEGSSSPESGKFVKVDLPVTSPKNARDAWNGDRVTSLLKVDPRLHCLAIDGDEKKYDGGGYFVACASLHSTYLGADACSVGTHAKASRLRLELSGPTYMVKMRASSAATKPKVLAGAQLLEGDLPGILVECGQGDVLQELEAPPSVWKLVLDHYPGRRAMERLVEGKEVHSTVKVEEVDEDASRGSVDPFLQRVPRQVDVARPGDLSVSSGAGEKLPNVDDDASSLNVSGTNNWGRNGELSVGPPSWRGRGGAVSLPGVGSPRDWEASLLKSEIKGKAFTNSRFTALDKQLDKAFGSVDQKISLAVAESREMTDEAMAKATSTELKVERIRAELEGRIAKLEVQGHLEPGELRVNTAFSPVHDVPLQAALQNMSDADQTQLLEMLLKQLDLDKLATAVGSKLGFAAIKQTVEQDNLRLNKVEYEFASEHGAVNKLQEQVATWDARRNTSSSERGGCVFSGPQDVQALVELAGKDKLCTLCLDMIGMLTLAQDPYVTYEAGMQVHANAIKANFGSVAESRVKVSFEIPYPEMIVKCVETASTAGRGGAKWAPMFATAELFEDDFRDGSHRRVIKGIENAYELTQKALDQDFPLAIGGEGSANNRKIHTILSDQNRRAYRQCLGFIECLLPFYRTLKGGSLSSEEAWDRVFVFVMEVLTSLREVRVISSNMSKEASMIWGCFKATDLGEEFRKQKFVEHPKALSILALTSIEREGKTMALLEQRIAKQIADANKNDKITKLDTRVQTVENKLKNIISKNPELK